MLLLLWFAAVVCGSWSLDEDEDEGAHDESLLAASTYPLSSKNTEQLKELNELRDKVLAMPLTPSELSSWRIFAQVHSAHFSTMLEGNVLTPEDVHGVWEQVWVDGSERDLRQVKGYLKALELIEKWGEDEVPLKSEMVTKMNELMVGRRHQTGEDDEDREAQQLQQLLLDDVVDWVKVKNEMNPCPVVAGIAHYQLANTQPFHDANSTTARLLANLVLRLGKYHLDGLTCVERHYALEPKEYRDAIAVGNSSSTAIWLDYFLDGLVVSFKDVVARLELRAQINQRGP